MYAGYTVAFSGLAGTFPLMADDEPFEWSSHILGGFRLLVVSTAHSSPPSRPCPFLWYSNFGAGAGWSPSAVLVAPCLSGSWEGF